MKFFQIELLKLWTFLTFSAALLLNILLNDHLLFCLSIWEGEQRGKEKSVSHFYESKISQRGS